MLLEKTRIFNNVFLIQLFINYSVFQLSLKIQIVSKFAKANYDYFEFHATHYFVQSLVINEVLVQGDLGPNDLCAFPTFQLQPPPHAKSDFFFVNYANLYS